MKTITLILIIILSALHLSGCSLIGKRLPEEEIQKIITRAKNSKIIAVDIYHTRCETCRLIEPVVKSLEKYYKGNNEIVFIKYDLSNPFTLFDSMKIAKALGLESIYKAQRYSGIVLIIDTKSKKVLDTIVAETNHSIYASIINKRLKDNAT